MGFLKSLGKVASLGMNPKDILKGGAIAGSVGLLGNMGGGALLAPLLGGAMSAYGADQAIKKQIAWERERATHAHQWEVQDLINAGLNPILSAEGSGAVTGGISAPVPDFSAIANSGAEVARIKNENKLAKSTIKYNDSQVELNKTNTGLNKANTELTELQKESTKQNTLHTAEMVRRAKAEADLAEAQRDAQLPLLRSEKYYNETEQAQTMHNLNQGPGVAKNLAYHLISGIDLNTAEGIKQGKAIIKNTINFLERIEKKWEQHKENNKKYSKGYL